MPLNRAMWFLGGVNPVPFGSIYSKSSWTDLSDFVVNGAVTPTVSGGKISFTGGAGVYTNSLDLVAPGYTMLENYTMTVRIENISNGAAGGAIGTRSYNNNYPHSMVGALSSGISLSAGSPIGVVAGSFSAFTVLDNHTYDLVLQKVGPAITVKAKETNGTVVATNTRTFSLVNVTEPLLDNTGRFSIFTFGGTFNITSIDISTTDFKFGRVAILGDSISQGYGPSTYANGFAQKLKTNYPSLVLMAGENDYTNHALLHVPQVIAFKPQKVLLEIGVNDVGNSVAPATYQANYASIVSQLQAAGIQVLHLKPYNTNFSVTTLQNYITTTYGSAVIDPATGGAGNFRDGTHYNDTGNTAVYNAIVNSGLI